MAQRRRERTSRLDSRTSRCTGWTITLDDVDVIELNEAFAAQSLAVIKDLDLDPAKVNPNGGAIALGHPIAATGAVITTKILGEMERNDATDGRRHRCESKG